MGVRSVAEGFELQCSEDEVLQRTFLKIYSNHEAVTVTDARTMLTIPQTGHVDSVNRVLVDADS